MSICKSLEVKIMTEPFLLINGCIDQLGFPLASRHKKPLDFGRVPAKEVFIIFMAC